MIFQLSSKLTPKRCSLGGHMDKIEFEVLSINPVKFGIQAIQSFNFLIKQLCRRAFFIVSPTTPHLISPQHNTLGPKAPKNLNRWPIYPENTTENDYFESLSGRFSKTETDA